MFWEQCFYPDPMFMSSKGTVYSMASARHIHLVYFYNNLFFPCTSIPLKFVYLKMESKEFFLDEYVLEMSMWYFSPIVPVFNFQINGSLARKAIKDLMARGSIRMISAHSSQQIYTRATNTWSAFCFDCLYGNWYSYFLNWTHKLEYLVQMCHHLG